MMATIAEIMIDLGLKEQPSTKGTIKADPRAKNISLAQIAKYLGELRGIMEPILLRLCGEI